MTLNTEKRILWVDIYKGLVILLVVIGHSTGSFNPFIYQFHMAAFFFISGYTANINKKTILETVINKFCTLLMPLFTIFFLLLGLVIALNKLHIYSVFFSEPLQEINIVIKTFFKTGDNYVFWMGACWFIVTLFGITVLHKILYTLCGGSINLIYAICSILVFLYGYHLVKIQYIPQWSIFDIDMIYIGQVYYSIGIFAKKKNIFLKFEELNFYRIIISIISICLLLYFAKINLSTVDYPSRRFGNPFEDALVATNGIFFCYYVAKKAEKMPSILKNGLMYLGRNTIGILFFHFMFFNVGFYLLYLLGIVPLNYLKNFVPTDEIGRIYWPLIVAVSVTLSLLLWKLLCIIPAFKFLLGQDKSHYVYIWGRLCQIRIIQKIIAVKQSALNQIKQISWNKYGARTVNLLKLNKAISIFFFLFLALACIPLIQPYIMCNDELQSRFWSLQGLSQYFDHMINAHINRGRALSAYFVSFSMYMGFLGVKEGLFRIIPAITICVDSILFGYLVFKILKDKYLSIFLSICIIAFLPITFEHTSPNAFTALYNIPFMFLLISLITYVEFLNNGRKEILVLSLILFFITLTSYEIFVTYTPLYFILAWYKIPRNEWGITRLLKKWVAPLIVSILFLVLYIIFGKIFPSDYDGNQIGNFTITRAIAIIIQLFQASFPGYFLFNKKYQYLMSIFWEAETVWQIVTLRMTAIVVVLVILCYLIFCKTKVDKITRTGLHHAGIIGVGLCFIILPTIPLSVAKMYQGIINSNNFIALPTTFFTYFSAMFVVCYLIWIMIQKIQSKRILLCIAISVSLYCLLVQAMNETILDKHLSAYDRLTTLEALFETSTMKLLDNQKVFSSDIYKTENTLGIQDGYWTQYAKSKGLNISVIQSDEEGAVYLAYPDDKYFILAIQNEIVILSRFNLEGKMVPVKLGKAGTYLEEIMTDGNYDKGFYVYTFTIYGDNLLQPQNKGYIPFQDIMKTVGNTLDTCDLIEGYWEDGWVAPKSCFKIASGSEGKVIVTGYYPFVPTGDEIIQVSVNGTTVMRYIIPENIFHFEVSCESNKEVTIELKSNFSKVASANDKRELSFILSELEGK